MPKKSKELVLCNNPLLVRIGEYQDGIFYELRESFRNAPRGEFETTHYHIVLNEAVKNNDINAVKRILLCQKKCMNETAIFEAIKCNSIDMCKVLIEYGMIDGTAISQEAFQYACINNPLDMVKFLWENLVCYLDDIFCDLDQLCLSQCLQVLEYAQAKIPPTRIRCTVVAMDVAVQNGSLDIVKFLHYNRSEGCSNTAMNHAAYANRFELLKFLSEVRHEQCTTYAMDMAANNGNLEMVKYLHTYRREGCTPSARNMALNNGHKEVAAYLEESGLV